MKFLRAVTVIILMILFFAANSFAVTHYTRAGVGLVSDTVTAIFMDPSGSIWIGTDLGVSRFNGLEWKTYRKTNAGFPAEFINDMMADSEGNIYFATTGGVTVYDSPRWENLSISLPSPDVESMVIDASENIWFATGDGLSKYRNFKIEEIFKVSNSDIPNDFIHQVEMDSFDFFWLATGAGLSRFDGVNSFVNYDSLTGLPADNVKSVAIENGPTDDIIWVATDSGVARRMNNVWSTITTFDGLLENDVKYVLVDYQNNKWFATATKGVSVLTGTGFQQYTFTDNSLVDDNTLTVAVDNSENIWVGTQGGATRIGDNGIVSFDKILYLNVDAKAYVTVNDSVMNTDPNTAETLSVKVYSTTDPAGINLTLTETDIDTGRFSSNVADTELLFSYSASDEANRMLLVTKGDQIFASYSETDVSADRLAIAYYNEEAPFSDDIFLDPPCFIATASYEDKSYSGMVKRFFIRGLEILGFKF